MNDDSKVVPDAIATPKRRRKGAGGIEYSKSRDAYRGHYRDSAGLRVRLPWCSVRRDAEEQLQAALEMMSADGGLSVGGITLRKWGEKFLERRELEGHRAFRKDGNRWNRYIVSAHFIDWPLDGIARKDVKRWLAELGQQRTFGRGGPRKKAKKKTRLLAGRPDRFLAWQTRKHALVLLRKAFDVAIDDELVDSGFANPCHGLKLKRPPTVDESIHYLTRDEIVAVQKVTPPCYRPLIEFAIATGLRQGEMRALRDADIHLDAEVPFVTVRYGAPPKKPTKSGAPRDVPLLPMAQRALAEWRAFRKTWCTNNFKGLAFPAQRGGYRSEGKLLGREHQKLWKAILKSAGIHTHIVWHDLRHTCATALLGGFFGKRWRLEEIQQLLGHADVETTQIYAHALKETLNDAARETLGDIGGDDDASNKKGGKKKD